MRKVAYSTYAINGAQLFNMAVNALAVPAVIGIEAYGKFAAVFAAPAILQSTLEAYAAVSLSASSRDRRFWPRFSGIAAVALAGVFVLYFAIFDVTAAILSVGLGATMIFRGSVSSAVYMGRAEPVALIVLSEFITLAVYLSVLALALYLGSTSYVIPIAMIFFASICSGVMMLALRGKQAAPSAEGVRPPLSLHLLLSRFYEDAIITVTPLFLAKVFGLTVAGDFRILASLMKGLSKAFPFRWEMLLRSIKIGQFHYGTFFKFAMVFAASGIPLYAAVVLQPFVTLSHPSIALITLTAGMLVTSLAAFPAAAALSPGISVAAVVSAFCLFGAGAITARLPVFVAIYSATNVFIFCYTLAVLHTRRTPAGEPKG